MWDGTKFSRFLNRRSTLEGNRAGYSSNLFTYYSPYSRNNRSIGTIFLSKILAALELRPFLSPTLPAKLFSLFFFQCQADRSLYSLSRFFLSASPCSDLYDQRSSNLLEKWENDSYFQVSFRTFKS